MLKNDEEEGVEDEEAGKTADEDCDWEEEEETRVIREEDIASKQKETKRKMPKGTNLTDDTIKEIGIVTHLRFSIH